MNNKIIYLDHAAATPLDGRVLEAMQPYLVDQFYNPSSPYEPARQVRRDYESAKQVIAAIIGTKADELVMTAGATESINLAFASIGGHIVTTDIEHQSVLVAAGKYDHTLVAVDKYGLVDPVTIKEAIQPTTRLVSVALANSEIGTIQALSEIADEVRAERSRRLETGDKTPIYLHSDASQGAGQLDIHVFRLGVDMLTLNAAKVYGPKQVGLLWADNSIGLKPQIAGGGQERGLRGGTENVAGVIGFARALEIADKKRSSEVTRLSNMRDLLIEKFTSAFPETILSGHPRKCLSSHLSISFPGLDAERLIFRLENRGVLVATGSACAASSHTRSHVLVALGLSPEVIDGSLRISLGRLSNIDDIKLASDIIIEEVRREYQRIG